MYDLGEMSKWESQKSTPFFKKLGADETGIHQQRVNIKTKSLREALEPEEKKTLKCGGRRNPPPQPPP